MKKNSMIFSFLLLLGISLAMNACKKEEFGLEETQAEAELSADDDLPEAVEGNLVQVSEEEAENRLRTAIEELTELSKIVLQHDDARTELYFLAQNEHYGDYYVGLYDVMHPESSELYQQTYVPQPVRGALRSRITSLVQKDALKQFTNLSFYLYTDPEQLRDFSNYYQQAGLYFYCPYCPDYQKPTFYPTLVPATIDADQGPGYAFVGRGEYRTVMVDEDYAAKTPTVIITGEKKGGVESGPTPKTPPPPPSPICPEDVTPEVYLGHVQLLDHFENMISFTGNGGKSEIKIIRIHGALDVAGNGDINELDAAAVISIDFKRKDVRKERWKWTDGILWDPAWGCEDLEQMIGVYEEDNEGKIKFKGAIKYLTKLDTIINVGTEVSLGVDVERISKDEIIYQQTFESEQFFDKNQENGPAGLKEGEGFFEDEAFRIYNGGKFKLTLPHLF